MSYPGFSNEELHQIFAHRLEMIAESIRSTPDKTGPIISRAVRYILLNNYAVEPLAEEIERFVLQSANDNTIQVAMLSLIVDVLTKAQLTMQISERYKPILSNIVYRMAESKNSTNIMRAKEAVDLLYKREIYTKDFIDELIDGIGKRALMDSHDIGLTMNIFMDLTSELEDIKKRRIELEENPQTEAMAVDVIKQELCQRDKFIEFHSDQITDLGVMINQVKTEIDKISATEEVSSKLDQLLGSLDTDSSDSESSDDSSSD